MYIKDQTFMETSYPVMTINVRQNPKYNSMTCLVYGLDLVDTKDNVQL